MMDFLSESNMLTVSVNGVDKTVYAVGSGDIRVTERGFTCHGGCRVYLAEKSVMAGADMYWEIPLQGHTFEYDADVSQVGCHCNSALYMAKMPAYGAD